MTTDLFEGAAPAADLAGVIERLEALEAHVGIARAEGIAAGFPHATREWVAALAGIVAEEWSVPLYEVLGPSRRQIYVRPRFVLVWLLREAGGYSFTQVARLTGRLDHTTTIWARNRTVAWRDADPNFRLVTYQLFEIARTMRDRRSSLAEPALVAESAA